MTNHSPSAGKYYWEGCKVFGQECYRTWRQELAIGVVIAIVTYLLTYQDKTAFEQFIVVAEATAIVFAFFVLAHAIRTPLLLHHDRIHPQGWRQVQWKFGVFGIVLLVGLVATISYRLIKPWAYPLPNITINLPGPPPQENPHQSAQNRPSSQPPKSTTRLVPPQSASQPPANPLPGANNQITMPQTQLERLTLMNRNYSKGDRERLAEALYQFSQSLDNGLNLMSKVNVEQGAISTEGANIANNYQSHIAKLREISPLTKQYAKEFMALRTKWAYYREQTEYVFGDNPDNLGPNSLTNAAEGLANYLERWGAIQNKDNQNILNLLSEAKNDCYNRILTFANWNRECKARLEQMKASIQVSSSSNLQSPRTSPAVQMF